MSDIETMAQLALAEAAVQQRLDGFSIAMMALSGSRGYGTHREKSDWDFRGIYVADTVELTLLTTVPEHITITPDLAGDAGAPDVAIYELGRFCRLAADGNPNIIELLFVDTLTSSRDWQDVAQIRSSFLSQAAVKKYGGYARAQLKKLANSTGETGSTDSEDGIRRRRKFCMHTARLVLNGTQLATTGHVDVCLTENDKATVLAAADLGASSSQAFIEKWEPLVEAIVPEDMAGSPLPKRADFDTINATLRTIRQRHL